MTLGVKNGIVDKFDNGFYDYLINHKATTLINNEESLKSFLENKRLDVSDNVLAYCGLKNDKDEFDVGGHLLKCLEEFKKNNETKNII